MIVLKANSFIDELCNYSFVSLVVSSVNCFLARPEGNRHIFFQYKSFAQ